MVSEVVTPRLISISSFAWLYSTAQYSTVLYEGSFGILKSGLQLESFGGSPLLIVLDQRTLKSPPAIDSLMKIKIKIEGGYRSCRGYRLINAVLGASHSGCISPLDSSGGETLPY
jgi:hypothetical protein